MDGEARRRATPARSRPGSTGRPRRTQAPQAEPGHQQQDRVANGTSTACSLARPRAQLRRARPAPSRDDRRLVAVMSTTVDGRPPGQAPPSSATARCPPRLQLRRTRWRATAPATFAEVRSRAGHAVDRGRQPRLRGRHAQPDPVRLIAAQPRVAPARVRHDQRERARQQRAGPGPAATRRQVGEDRRSARRRPSRPRSPTASPATAPWRAAAPRRPRGRARRRPGRRRCRSGSRRWRRRGALATSGPRSSYVTRSIGPKRSDRTPPDRGSRPPRRGRAPGADRPRPRPGRHRPRARASRARGGGRAQRPPRAGSGRARPGRRRARRGARGRGRRARRAASSSGTYGRLAAITS